MVREAMSSSNLPDWVTRVRELYDEGATDVEVIKELKWSEKQFSEYYTTSEGFKALVDFGRLSSKAWWMQKGRKNLENRSFNTPLYALHMKNRFGWAEKQETTDNSKPIDNMSQDELKEEFQKSLPLMAKYLKSEGMTDAKVLTLVGKSK
jgi:hypothetical protein